MSAVKTAEGTTVDSFIRLLKRYGNWILLANPFIVSQHRTNTGYLLIIY